MFRITQGKGFHITFANGWTISVQFGPGNYGDNYNLSISEWFAEQRKASDFILESQTAEIAAWDKDNNWYIFEDGEIVKGYVTVDEVLDFMNKIANIKSSDRVLTMREIKFRAWDEKHKKMWFTGQEGESVGEYTFQTYFDPNDGSLKALIYGNDFLVTDDPYPMYDREEIHLPLMQYTGLKDKNGKEIYKGDVVDIHYPDNVDSRGDTIDRIILNNKQKFIEFLYRTMVDSSIQFLEVIGNIYENPELLKED